MTSDAERATSWRRLALLLAAVLAVTVIASGALLLRETSRSDDDPPDDASSSSDADLYAAGLEAEMAAREVIVRMTTYDWRTVDEDFSWVDGVGTEEFRSFFAEASTTSKQAITSLQVTAKGEVVASAPTVTDVDHVTVLLFVDQQITSAKQEGTSTDQPRVTMTMERVDGAWLADRVDIDGLVGAGAPQPGS